MAGELQGIADWRLVDVLGEGARAVVYRASRLGAGQGEQHVAIEVLRVTASQDPDAVEAFEARAAVGARLADRRIAAVIETGRADGRPYVVSELCEGLALETLPVRRSTGRLRPQPAMWVLREITAALAAAGREDPPVVHGALDAGDVLIDVDGEVVLAGFGLIDSPQADLLALARLAQDLCRVWPPEIDAWIDRLQDGEDAFDDTAAALDGFPAVMVDEVAARRGVASTVKRALRKREETLASQSPSAPGPAKATPSGAGAATPAAPGQAKGPAQPATTRTRPRSTRPKPAPDAGRRESFAAAQQARHVAWFCMGLLGFAAVIEFFRYGG